MPRQNRAVQIDQFFAGVRDSAGAILADGVVFPYVAGARNQAGNFVYRRANVWRDADRIHAFSLNRIDLGASGLPQTIGSQSPSVYSDGSLRLLYYPSTATNLPDGSEEGLETLPVGIDQPDRVETIFISTEIVNAAHFGAIGNADYETPQSGADDTDALQAAIDYCLNDDNARPKILYIPGGTYRITRPLIVMRTYSEQISSGGAVTKVGYCAIHIHGEKRGLGDAYGDTRIYAEFNDRPALAIQGGFGVVVRDLSFIGVNRYDIPVQDAKKNQPDQTLSFAMYHDDAVFNYNWTLHPWSTPPPYPLTGLCRDCLQSPYAGIAIDPFSPASAPADGSLPPGVTTANQYPGLNAHYGYAPDSYHYSTAVVIEDCAFLRFVVGVIVSPTGRNANAENVVIRNVLFQTNKVALAICQSQTRGLQLENCAVLQCHTVVDNRTYGAGTDGSAPNIRGLTVSEAKFLFNVNAQVSALRFEQIYAEAFLSLGYLGADYGSNQGAITIAGSTFDFQLVRPAANTHSANFASLKFTDCMFSITGGNTAADEFPPIMFYNRAPLVFENCHLLSGRNVSNPPIPQFPIDWGWANSAPAWGFHDPLLVRVESVRIRDNVVGGHTGYASAAVVRREHLSVARNTMDETSGLVRQIVPPGARVAPAAPLSGATPFHRLVKGDVNEISIPSATVKSIVQGQVGSVTFSGATGMLLPGDVVYAFDANNAGPFMIPHYKKAVITGLGDVAPLTPTDGFNATGPIGVIASASGGNNVVAFVPKAFLDLIGMGMTLTLRIRRFGRYHPATVGDLRPDSPTILNVVVEGYGSASGAWKVGDRVFTDSVTPGGLPIINPGTYVVSVSSTSMLLSRNPNGNVTGARLFDAEVFRFAGTRE